MRTTPQPACATSLPPRLPRERLQPAAEGGAGRAATAAHRGARSPATGRPRDPRLAPAMMTGMMAMGGRGEAWSAHPTPHFRYHCCEAHRRCGWVGEEYCKGKGAVRRRRRRRGADGKIVKCALSRVRFRTRSIAAKHRLKNSIPGVRVSSCPVLWGGPSPSFTRPIGVARPTSLYVARTHPSTPQHTSHRTHD